MQQVPWQQRQLSRLMLGTVQFGMPYGVANQTGQPGYAEVLEILSTALAGGVNCFDTAAAYGESEAVLGRALRELNVAERVVVVTKVRPLTPAEQADPAAAALAIEQSVAESRRRLQLDRLPVVLFHRESDGKFLPVLQELQGRRWVEQIGVSCDNRPGPAEAFVAAGNCAAVQLPGNLLDPRHLRSGVLPLAKERGVAVFLRSVYLQGLLVMPEAQIPAKLEPILPVRRRLEALAQEAGLRLSELAVRAMLAQDAITCILVGVETAAQMRENLAIFESDPLPADLLAAVELAVPELPEALITPSMWPAL